MLGAFNVAGSVPMLLLGARGGEMVDRLDKRRILLLTQVVMMVLALAFSALVFSGQLQLWHIFAMCFLVGVTEAWEFPASQSLGPELVAPEQIPQAVAMMQSIFQGGRLLGPALAGWMIARFGDGSAFLANGLSFLAVIISLLIITPRAKAGPAEPPRPRTKGAFRDGLRYARNEPVVRALLTLLALMMTLIMPVMVLLSYFTRHVLHADAAGMGSLMSVTGVGALVGTGVIMLASPASWPRRLWFAVVVCGAAVCGLALSTSLGVAMGFAALLSLSTAITMGTINQTVQTRVPDAMRGRVMALFGMIFTSVVPLASIIVTLMADWAGVPLLMGVCGGLYLVIGVVLLLRLPSAAPAAGEPEISG